MMEIVFISQGCHVGGIVAIVKIGGLRVQKPQRLVIFVILWILKHVKYHVVNISFHSMITLKHFSLLFSAVVN